MMSEQLGILLNLLTLVISVGIAIYSARASDKSNRRQLALERRFEVYSELAGYLQEVTSNHDKASRFRDKIYGLITKTYFFASEPINELFQELLNQKIYDKEIRRVNNQGESRDRSFNDFDAHIWVLIECMKYEARFGKDITSDVVAKEREKQFDKIGTRQHTDTIIKSVKSSSR